jgi:hypothetical protein
MNLDLLLEAERRGILPADKAQLLAEARRRGLVPGAAPAGPTNTNPGVNPEAPPEMLLNPQTGQYTSRELLTNAMQPSRAEAAQIGGMQGLSFGGADEVMGGAAALTDGAEGYTFGREYTRSAEDAARRDFPWTTGGAEVAGAATTALTYGAPAWSRYGMTGTPGAMASGATLGGLEGLVYGGLSGEGSGRDRVVNALKFAGMGIGAGGAVPVVTSLARAGGRMIGDLVGGGVDMVVGKGRQGRADRALAATMQRAGMSPDDIGRAVMEAAQDGQSMYRAGDALGQAGQRRMSGIVRAGGDASQEVADFLKQRQLDQPERVAGFVSDAYDGAKTAAATRTELTAGRDAAAATNYGAARAGAGPVNLTPTIETIDDLLNVNPILGETALARSDIGQRIANIRGRMQAGGEQLIDFNEVLTLKQELGGQIENLRNAGKRVPPQLAAVYGKLDEALEASSDGYRLANDSFRDASRTIDAVDEGADMIRPGNRAADTTARFSAMTPEQQAAARVGYGNQALAKVEASAGEMTNRARPFTSTKLRTEAGTIANDPDTFLRRIDREMTMHDTMSRALGGSRTADNLEDISDLAGYDSGPLVNVLTGNFRAAAQQALQKGSNALTGMTPETRRIVSQALLAKDDTAFRRAIAKAETSDARKAVVDAIIRLGAQREEYGGLVQ